MTHPTDLLALAAMLRAFADEIRRIDNNPVARSKFFDGEPLRVPLPMEAEDHGKWLEVRIVDVAEVVEDALLD